MERLTRAVSVAFVGVAAVLRRGRRARGADARASCRCVDRHAGCARRSGTITGTVIDERGGAAAGAMVSALGVTLASTVTDERGQFTLNQLPAGEYLLRAHMLGFAASTGADGPRRRHARRSSVCSCAASTRVPPWHDRHGRRARQGAADHRRRLRSAARRRARPTADAPRRIIRTTKPRGGCVTSSAAS